jgi:hypothetical protein
MSSEEKIERLIQTRVQEDAKRFWERDWEQVMKILKSPRQDMAQSVDDENGVPVVDPNPTLKP